MFGFSRRRMKIGRLKVQLSDTASGTRSPIRHVKRLSKPSNVEDVSLAQTTSNSDEKNCRNSPAEAELENCTSGNSESWIGLSTAGDSPTPRFNHAATVIGNNKMVVVGGENGQGLLDDVQVLNFENFTWTKASSKLYLSPSSLPLKIPACKGHSLVPWGKKMLLIGGKTNPGSDRISVWAFDTETECWSLIEAKGETPVARCGHTVIRAITVLILFGGEDAKGRKLNDLHMFDLKSFMWLPLHCTGTAPSPRSNHVAALYDDRTLYVFGGVSKSRTLNDLYSLDFETMIWSRIKIRGFHPSPRAGCCGVLCGYKWYIAGGGSRKKRHAETLVFDVLKLEWAVAVASPPSSITTNKGFSLVLVQHNDKTCLVAFGGYKKEPSNQAEVLVMDRSEQSVGQRSTLDKGLRPLLFESHSSTLGFAAQSTNEARKCPIDSVARQNLASVLEDRGSSRRSVSDSSLVDPNPSPGNGSLRKQFHKEEEYSPTVKVLKNHEGEKCKELSDYSILKDSSVQELKIKQAIEDQTDVTGNTANDEGIASICYNDETVLTETDGKSVGLQQSYEAKLASVVRKNSIIEGQLTAALASREAAEKNLSSVMKSRQEMEKKLSETVKEMELLKEKLSNVEIAQEEANTLSNVVHSDNVRLEHDVAFLKAILEDTQKELHSTRGVLAGERARAFQLQVEVFHLKQRLQSLENRSTTPRKPFHM